MSAAASLDSDHVVTFTDELNAIAEDLSAAII